METRESTFGNGDLSETRINTFLFSVSSWHPTKESMLLVLSVFFTPFLYRNEFIYSFLCRKRSEKRRMIARKVRRVKTAEARMEMMTYCKRTRM